jgi:hypothetical protein
MIFGLVILFVIMLNCLLFSALVYNYWTPVPVIGTNLTNIQLASYKGMILYTTCLCITIFTLLGLTYYYVSPDCDMSGGSAEITTATTSSSF